MFIPLCLSPDRPFILSLIATLKKQYPHLAFTLHDQGDLGLQLRLENCALEEKPEAFIRGFTAAWEVREGYTDHHIEDDQMT